MIEPPLDPLIRDSISLAEQLLHLRLEEPVLPREVDRRHFEFAEVFDLPVCCLKAVFGVLQPMFKGGFGEVLRFK